MSSTGDMSDSPTQWAWLKDTYWYVRTPDLPALQLDPEHNLLSWLVDQTVWHISGYKNGYFWGVAATLLHEAGSGVPTSRPPHISQVTMIGTVLPDGNVQITFQSIGRRDTTPTIGFGSMVKVDGAWAFQMQMSTDRVNDRMLHWANMTQTREGESGWRHLPGNGYSVPQMLAGADYPQFDDQKSKGSNAIDPPI
jgi:hypothetical protein